MTAEIENELRNGALRLGRFTVSELAAATGVKRAWLYRHMGDLEALGICAFTGKSKTHGGPGRPAPVYRQTVVSQRTWRAMHAQPTPRSRRPHQTPVEVEARQHAPRPRHAPTGRKLKVTNPEIRRLLEAADAAGCTVKPTRNGHYRLLLPDGTTASAQGTPSDWRGVLNLRASLRRANVPV